MNGELDTVPAQYHNQFTFGRVIREVAKDRTKDVVDIRDITKVNYGKEYRANVGASSKSLHRKEHYIYPYFRIKANQQLEKLCDKQNLKYNRKVL